MKKILVLVAFILTYSTLKSQNYFEQLPFPDSTDIYNLAFSQQGDIYAAVGSLNVTKSGLYKSSDSGQTWNMILYSGQVPTGDIDIDNEGNLYALIGGTFDESLFKSTDDGETWNGIYVPVDIDYDNTALFIKGIDTLFIAQAGGSFTRLIRSYDDGMNWDTVFYRTGYSSESIVDLAFGQNGEIFMAISGFMVGNGGLFKSNDYGNIWNLFGLQGNMVMDLDYNSNGDLFIAAMEMNGTNGPGLYEVCNSDNVVSPVSLGFPLTSVVINTSDDIFAGYFNGGAVYHSSDNGTTYNWITSGLNTYAQIMKMYLDSQEFIYALSEFNLLYRSSESTITAYKNIETSNSVRIFPNPCNEILNINIKKGNITSEYDIYTLNGIRLLGGLIQDGNSKINTSDFKPGLYILKFKDKETVSILFKKM